MKTKILVPVEVPGSKDLSEALISTISSFKVILLGYNIVPEQTAPSQAKENLGEEALNDLEQISQNFEKIGGDVEIRLVFTHNKTQTLDRVANEERADAVLIPKKVKQINKVLIPLRSNINIRRITKCSLEMLGEVVEFTLFHVVAKNEEKEDSKKFLTEAKEILVQQGINPENIETKISKKPNTVNEIVKEAKNFDLIVMGETEPSIRSLIFGDIPTKVSNQAGRPIIVIRRET